MAIEHGLVPLLELVASREADRKPLPKRIFVGHQLWKAIEARCEKVEPKTTERPWPIASMYGIPIVSDIHMPPDGWWPDDGEMDYLRQVAPMSGLGRVTF